MKNGTVAQKFVKNNFSVGAVVLPPLQNDWWIRAKDSDRGEWTSCQPKAICWFGGNFSFDATFETHSISISWCSCARKHFLWIDQVRLAFSKTPFKRWRNCLRYSFVSPHASWEKFLSILIKCFRNERRKIVWHGPKLQRNFSIEFDPICSIEI